MKSYVKVLLLLLIPLLLVASYSMWGGDWWLEKTDFSELKTLIDSWTMPADDEVENGTDTVFAVAEVVPDSVDSICVAEVEPAPMDTANQKILFFGDSMLEGLSRRLCDYAMENGHELTSVIWYSSTSQTWAECDTLEHFIKKTSPSFMVVCLCSNELFVRDLKERDEYIGRIVSKMCDVPFVWISPPNWKEDTGINDLIIKHVGKDRYFDSRHLELKRGRDRVHPTFDAAEGWMDSVAVWMSSDSTRHPIRMDVPQQQRPRKFKQILLLPPS